MTTHNVYDMNDERFVGFLIHVVAKILICMMKGCLLFLCRIINSYHKMTWICQHNFCSQQTVLLFFLCHRLSQEIYIFQCKLIGTWYCRMFLHFPNIVSIFIKCFRQWFYLLIISHNNSVPPILVRDSLKQIMSYQHKDHKDFVLRQPVVWYEEKPRSKLVHTMDKHKNEKGHIMRYWSLPMLHYSSKCAPHRFFTVINAISNFNWSYGSFLLVSSKRTPTAPAFKAFIKLVWAAIPTGNVMSWLCLSFLHCFLPAG